MTEQPYAPIPQWTVSDRLRKAREFAQLEQQDLADDIGVSRGTVSNYERGIVKPRKIMLKAWSLRTGVPIEWLETGEIPHPGGDGGQRGTLAGTGGSTVNRCRLRSLPVVTFPQVRDLTAAA